MANLVVRFAYTLGLLLRIYQAARPLYDLSNFQISPKELTKIHWNHHSTV